MNANYLRNDVLLRKDNTSHRILHIQPEAKPENSSGATLPHAWLIELNEPKALPYRMLLDSLHLDYSHPTRAKKQKNGPADRSHASMATLGATASEAMKKVGKRAFARIAPLVENPEIFNPTTRHALLVERSQQIGGGTPKTLLRNLRSYWQGGQTQKALYGKYDLCGQVVGTGNRGRNRQKSGDFDGYATLRPFQIGANDREYMRAVIEEYYLVQDSEYTLQSTLEKLHELHYQYVDGNGEECLLHRQECPTYRQFEYFLKTNWPLAERLEKRKGAKKFAQDDRATEGSIQRDCHGAGHIYEIDATILDVILVSAKDRAIIVGKPTLYLIIDRYSRLIVGWYLGFENACYTAAMQALLSIGEDKEDLCERLGIPFDPLDWPAHGVMPEQFLADQGELVSREARQIGPSLRCTITNIPGLRPDWKPLVECGFKMLHQVIAPDTPGYAPDAKARQRRAKNVDAEVSLDIHDLERKIVATIISQNRSMHKGYPLSLAQENDGVRPIPVELFAHSVRRRMGLMDRMDFNMVREELLPRGKAVVSGNGIEFKKVHYSCPEARDRGWLVEGRRKRKPAEVAFDYRLVDEIIVYSPNGKESFVATLTKDSVKFEGMTFKEVHQYFTGAEDLKADAIEINRQNKYKLRKLTQPTVDAAVKEAKAATKGVSRSSRRKDIAPARAAELGNERARSVDVATTRSQAVLNAASLEDFGTTVPSSSNVVSIGRGSPAAENDELTTLKNFPTNGQSIPRDKTFLDRVAKARDRL